MTDYFALLDQPRLPWLDREILKEIYHSKTLRTHPDSGATSEFADLNEAYQVLKDPKRRLQHLLDLYDASRPAANQTVPADLQELFLEICALNQRIQPLLEKSRTVSNELSRSLLKSQLLSMQKETAGLREKVGAMSAAAEEELKEMNSGWAADATGQIAALQDLHVRFAYLGRWIEQLDEMAFQISLN
jgi:curved DNA-binding protein CbpA